MKQKMVLLNISVLLFIMGAGEVFSDNNLTSFGPCSPNFNNVKVTGDLKITCSNPEKKRGESGDIKIDLGTLSWSEMRIHSQNTRDFKKENEFRQKWMKYVEKTKIESQKVINECGKCMEVFATTSRERPPVPTDYVKIDTTKCTKSILLHMRRGSCPSEWEEITTLNGKLEQIETKKFMTNFELKKGNTYQFIFGQYHRCIEGSIPLACFQHAERKVSW